MNTFFSDGRISFRVIPVWPQISTNFPIHPTVCFEAGWFTLTPSSWTRLRHRSRKWMSGHAATALAMRTIEDSSEPHLQNRLGKLIPPSQGKSPFSLDRYLSWMSRKCPVLHAMLASMREFCENVSECGQKVHAKQLMRDLISLKNKIKSDPARHGSIDDEERASNSLRELRSRARRATILLAKAYSSPDHNNKEDPLDELVFIILSQMTTYPSFERAYARLKSLAPHWEDILDMPLRRLQRIIKGAGLGNQKAQRLRALITRLKTDFGRVTLDPLREMPTRDAENYLVSLPGVQMKTAKCVLMYSLGRPVLPVDTHVLRVASRLGFTEARNICDAVHSSLEAIVAPRYRYAFHVNAISHGRAICLAKAPRCHLCVLSNVCAYANSNLPIPPGSTGSFSRELLNRH